MHCSVPGDRNIPFLLDSTSRLNLAAFYFTGLYYDLSKRITGLQYLTAANRPKGTAQYGVLGAFVLIQQAIHVQRVAMQSLKRRALERQRSLVRTNIRRGAHKIS